MLDGKDATNSNQSKSRTSIFSPQSTQSSDTEFTESESDLNSDGSYSVPSVSALRVLCDPSDSVSPISPSRLPRLPISCVFSSVFVYLLACINGSVSEDVSMIGVFDSGFGGLTVLSSLLKTLPQYDYLFLADSARAPYGARSADVVNEFTLESVEWLFDEGCTLVLLACNTASARALRNIQQLHLPKHRPDHRVLGVVRPSVEALAGLPPGAIPGQTEPATTSGVVAVVATESTIASDSYGLELRKLAPHLELIQQACPLWAPLVEAGELDTPGTEYFLRRSLEPILNRPQIGRAHV